MKREEYERLLLARLHARHRWETLPATGWSIADMDADEIRQTVVEAVTAKRIAAVPSEKPEAILRRLNLLADGHPTQAAVVLFGRNPLPQFPQCEIRLARFRGVTKSEFIDNRQFQGHAFTLLRQADAFFDMHLPVASRIVSGPMRREDRPQYPPEALREALVNALCHRDYSEAGASVGLAIFDDRLEVWSWGRLPGDLTPEKLRIDHPSVRRNELIAEVFYRRGHIERWGRGTDHRALPPRGAARPGLPGAGRRGWRAILGSEPDGDGRRGRRSAAPPARGPGRGGLARYGHRPGDPAEAAEPARRADDPAVARSPRGGRSRRPHGQGPVDEVPPCRLATCSSRWVRDYSRLFAMHLRARAASTFSGAGVEARTVSPTCAALRASRRRTSPRSRERPSLRSGWPLPREGCGPGTPGKSPGRLRGREARAPLQGAVRRPPDPLSAREGRGSRGARVGARRRLHARDVRPGALRRPQARRTTRAVGTRGAQGRNPQAMEDWRYWMAMGYEF